LDIHTWSHWPSLVCMVLRVLDRRREGSKVGQFPNSIGPRESGSEIPIQFVLRYWRNGSHKFRVPFSRNGNCRSTYNMGEWVSKPRWEELAEAVKPRQEPRSIESFQPERRAREPPPPRDRTWCSQVQECGSSLLPGRCRIDRGGWWSWHRAYRRPR
jgi:hypothetical protein